MSLIHLFRKKSNKKLFTTPSHSQKFFIFSKFRQFYKFDISETDAHNPQLALINAQKRAANIYNTRKTYFLTNGSTSGIISAVLTCASKDDKVLIWDNAHPCHLNSVKLAGAVPVFYELAINKDWGIFTSTPPELIEKYLSTQKIKAVIITSPTYEGFVSDIEKIKNTCKKYNTYLIVDEAHGALYPFSDKLPNSAINIADFTIQSLHKTAGGLNPTALLHVNCDLNPQIALDMITTTSPSYPLLASIEENINYLNSAKGRKNIENLITQIAELKTACNKCKFGGDDITKILVKTTGLSGYEISDKLFTQYNIEDEKTNEISTMLLCGIGTDIKKINKLKLALNKISNL